MLGYLFIRNLGPKAQAAFFYAVLPLLLFFRYLFGTFSGLIFFSLSLYGFMWHFSDSRPYSPAQLILWIDSLSRDYKTAFISSMLTVFGFLIAFHSTSSNCKAEALAKLKIDVALEIESFFNEAARLSTDLQIFAKSVIEAIERFDNTGPNDDTIFWLNRLIAQTSNYIAIRERVGAMTVEVHRIAGKNFAVIAGIPGAKEKLDAATNAFMAIAETRWFRIPMIEKGQTISVENYLAQVSTESCQTYINAYHENFDLMNGNSGGIRGMLLFDVTGFNLSSLLSIADRLAFVKIIATFQNKKR